MDVITFPKNLLNTSGLSILLRGVISLPDTKSYDKINILNNEGDVCFDSLRPSQQFFCLVRTGLPGLNQY